ncbi:hypothetical protein A374_06601 [Fictibacillus macauensis ZFHKF-1]|uniref:GrpB family protein n=1 Tax=Fictibacillus macauensis ZFHKF-1 TaxID=1196324 RepID=I8UHE6_9BACL|nr:GrpB family protein [Fictibacillus macauensis]EIT86248.1 hypothetical protein A374_06601 [Fictibacillus macauensis ZFHKF-1]
MRHVHVVPYNEEWLQAFQQEKARLEAVFGSLLVDVHHIGSTSIPAMAAKPIIDLLPVVHDITEVDQYTTQMAAIGYEGRGELGLPGRRFFRKGGDERTHHVHVYEAGHEDIARHLAFRDYLRSHQEEARTYAELKQQLAAQFPHDIEQYMDGKDDWIKTTEQIALRWYQQQS